MACLSAKQESTKMLTSPRTVLRKVFTSLLHLHFLKIYPYIHVQSVSNICFFFTAFSVISDQPVDAIRLLETCKNLSPHSLWSHSKEIVAQIRKILPASVPRKVQGSYVIYELTLSLSSAIIETIYHQYFVFLIRFVQGCLVSA